LPSFAYGDEMQGAFLGPEFSDNEIAQMNKQTKAIAQFYTDDTDMCAFVAKKLAEGNIIGWFQGRMEFGPRALGHRSILADPRNKEMQQKLNLKIKLREGFRPFAPAILEEKVAEYFELENLSPYMLFTAPIQAKHRFKLPANYSQLSINEKLRFQRSNLQPITHVDFSARVQTVNKNINPKFWHLIDSFYQNTGVPILINTSFNVRGEPIVCSPLDAYKCFMMTDIDYLVLGNFVYSKSQQNQISFKEYCNRIAFVEKNQ
jgi:carbamoyltransferase